jgi:hypothetical protein
MIGMETLDFCTTGMFIIGKLGSHMALFSSIWFIALSMLSRVPSNMLNHLDDIYPAPSASDQTPFLNVPGGAGTFSALGARILSPPPRSKRVGWVVDAGHDFPSSLRDMITLWDTAVEMRCRDGLTTKGWNGYGPNEHRGMFALFPLAHLILC